MTIDLKTIKHVSKLSRISLEDEKAKKLAVDLNSIFEFIEKLNELKTDNVEPLTSIAETTLKFRSDEVKSKDIDKIINKSLSIDINIKLNTINDIIIYQNDIIYILYYLKHLKDFR